MSVSSRRVPRYFIDAASSLIESAEGFPNLRVLELGCGDGILLERLQRAGCTVRGTTYLAAGDYIRTRQYPEGLQVDSGINLNARLPYNDAQFDLVVSTEVIEHIERHSTFILEAGRVLRHGGSLVLTFPNPLRLRSRLFHFLFGRPCRNRPSIPWGRDASHLYAYHQRLPDFEVLHYLLWRAGLRIASTAPSHEGRGERIAALVLGPLLRVLARRDARARPDDTAADMEGRRDLARWVAAPDILSCHQVCLRAVKRFESDAAELVGA